MSDLLVKLGHLSGASRFRRISEKLYVDGDQIYKNAGIYFKASWFSVYYALVGLCFLPCTMKRLSAVLH